jgi:Na+-translocating ferredoxin:NAD+ oxidoreductase RnfG subunit
MAIWEHELAEQADLETYRQLPAEEPVLAAYLDVKGNELLCVSRAPGYHEDVVVLVRFRDRVIDQVRILEEAETEDYGGYIREDWFLDRFRDMDPGHNLQLVKMSKKSENEVVAVTGATVSSRAVLEAVQATLQFVDNYEGGN